MKPFTLYVHRLISGWTFIVLLCIYPAPPPPTLAAGLRETESPPNEPHIYLLQPDKRGGKAYKLVYTVNVPINVQWNFKTDFEGSFLRTHKYIQEHHLISRKKNVVITEDVYSNVPNSPFRWRTILYPSIYRLDFTLENPEECGQRFHYGYIQLFAANQQTKVIHVAYFDFLGVSLWVHYPWKGGMSAFLDYTARWEQSTVLRLQGKYGGRATR
jgi:hypothetical protein